MRSAALVGGVLMLAAPAAAQQAETSGPTPMEERVAVIAVLDKVSQVVTEYEMSPGDSEDYRALSIRLVACEKTPPWAPREEEGAFLQIDDRRAGEGESRRLFSGWLFANSPSLNSFDNPAYDVWVRSCTMDFPDTPSGEAEN